MMTTAELREHREQLLTMISELRTNRIILDELANCYNVFLFTGGVVPRERWGLLAVTSYLQHPFAAGCISDAEAERYRHLAEAIMDLGEAITAGARPRTLRCRHDIADAFGRESSEIRALANTLELAARNTLDGLAAATGAATDPRNGSQDILRCLPRTGAKESRP